MLDNASYHKSDSALRVLRDLDIPVIFTGPHSYLASPCELLFAALKKDDINPRKI